MSDQEMKDIWNNADDGAKINIDLPLLVADLKGRLKKRDRSIFLRDAREIVAAVAVMIFFGQMAYMGSELISRIANALIAIWCVYVIYRLLDVRKHRKVNDLNKSLKVQMMQQKMYLRKQVHLIDTAWAWGIVPIVILFMLSIVGANFSGVFNWGDIVLPLIIFSLLSWGIHLLNKRVVRTTYKPMIEKIDSVLSQLIKDNI